MSAYSSCVSVASSNISKANLLAAIQVQFYLVLHGPKNAAMTVYWVVPIKCDRIFLHFKLSFRAIEPVP